MACKIEFGVTNAETESLTGHGSPGDERQILHEKDDYPRTQWRAVVLSWRAQVDPPMRLISPDQHSGAAFGMFDHHSSIARSFLLLPHVGGAPGISADLESREPRAWKLACPVPRLRLSRARL